MLTIERILNIYAAGIPQIISLSQYDDDFQLVFTLYTSEGEFTIPSGTTAEVMGTKVDGNGYSASASISGSTVTVTGNKQMTACAGRNVYEIVLTNSGKRLATVNFVLKVERAALDADTIQSETVLKELNAIIDSAATATEAATQAAASAAAAAESARTLTIDPTLTQSGQAADAKATGDAIAAIEPMSDDVKIALLNCFSHVYWSDEHGQDYYDALESALYPSEYPLITAVFNSGANTIYTDDTLNSLKQYLTVKYFETEESTGTVVPSANYTLSGVLIEGTSTIYVAYNDLRTSFVINNVVNFYNIMERSVSNGLMSLRKGGIGQTSGGDAKIIEYNQNYPRYSTYTTRGKRGMLANDDTTITNYYPIPVPSGATTAKIDITPNTQYFGIQQFSYDEITEIYNKEKDNGWQISGTTIQLELDKNVKFVTINLKYNSAGTSYLTVPTDVKITFE